MHFNVFPAGVAMVFGALALPALAQEMQPNGAQSNSAPIQSDAAQQSGGGQNGEQRGDLPTKVITPGEAPAGSNMQSRPATREMTSPRELPGVMGATTAPDSHAATARGKASNDNDPNRATRSTQTPR